VSEAVAIEATAAASGSRFLSVRIGWRNLRRNRRRTLLTSAGIGFAVFLVSFFMSFQYGMYGVMMDSATSLMVGHAEIRSRAYLDNERFEDTIADATPLLRRVEQTPGVVSVAPRVEAFALVSADERSFGAQVLGIDVAAEERTVRFTTMLKSGRGIRGGDEAVLGSVLARNLGVDVGGEVVVLGSSKQGGVAALALSVVGLLETGMTEIDRSLLLAPLSTVQLAFDLGDEVHSLVIRVDDIQDSSKVVAVLDAELPGAVKVRNWDEVIPELRQSIEVDKIGGQIMYLIIMVLVVFSVVNSFIMTVFERTREFGMLLSIGMRPFSIIRMMQWEAFFLWIIGASIGMLFTAGLIYWLRDVGIPMGEALEDYARQFYMPSRLHPGFNALALTLPPLVMLFGTQIAALLPSLRIRRLRPVEALRAE
jgi:ABC-type lipoprotein release transport system permease subunit